ncbi:MAG: GNAT family N-acetyltransferase [Desulfomonilaceae bacterium]|jgi:CelD/BcsL family acetyltransferase involved in cellulose biosynthesis
MNNQPTLKRRSQLSQTLRPLLSSSFNKGVWTWEVHDDLKSAETLWRGFEQEAASYVFQTFDWLYRWVEIVGKPVHFIKPCVVIVWKDSQLLFILPLGIRPEKGFKILEWLGGIHSDYKGPLIRKKSVTGSLTGIWDFIKKTLPKFDATCLLKQPAVIDGESNPCITANPTEQNRAYSIIMEGTWEQYQLTRVSTNLRADSRRKRRRLGELGDLKFVVASDHETSKRLTEIMFEQKSRRWSETGSWNRLAAKEHRHFYETITDDLLGNRVVHVSALEIDGIVIATHWGALYRKHFYWLMPTFEGGKWARYSPGRLLLEYLLEWCFNNGVERFDFTGGAEDYKLEWANHDMPLYQNCNGNNLKGKLYLQWLQSSSSVKVKWYGTSSSVKDFVKKSSIGPIIRRAYDRLR